jgi:glutaredoxin
MIRIYGKEDCPLCERAKALCIVNNLEYKYEEANTYTKPHEDWRTDVSIEVLAAIQIYDGKLPVIFFEDNSIMDLKDFEEWIEQQKLEIKEFEKRKPKEIKTGCKSCKVNL